MKLVLEIKFTTDTFETKLGAPEYSKDEMREMFSAIERVNEQEDYGIDFEDRLDD